MQTLRVWANVVARAADLTLALGTDERWGRRHMAGTILLILAHIGNLAETCLRLGSVAVRAYGTLENFNPNYAAYFNFTSEVAFEYGWKCTILA